MEMNHDARVIPLNGSPHLDASLRQWHGDSRGHWEDDTLVIETTNCSPKSTFRRISSEGLHLTERLTRVSPNTLNYSVAINDPTTWTKPWTVLIPLMSTNDAIYEYACHEGNIGMEGILVGARLEEKAVEEATQQSSR